MQVSTKKLLGLKFKNVFFLFHDFIGNSSTEIQTNAKHKYSFYNLGQRVGVGDKLKKLSKIGSFMESFTADFLQFFTKKCQNLAFGWTAGYSPSNQSISGIFWKFPNFLRS